VSWRAVKDNSLSASAPWNSTNLDWKWTRITMKGNNMTPWPVDGTSSSTAQVCWEGTHQMSTPYGTSTGCTPVGGVTSIIMVTTVSGYVSTVSLTAGGSGYSSAPTVVFTGDGSGATATATIATSTTVTAVALDTAGTKCYLSANEVNISITSGGGSGATATAT